MIVITGDRVHCFELRIVFSMVISLCVVPSAVSSGVRVDARARAPRDSYHGSKRVSGPPGGWGWPGRGMGHGQAELDDRQSAWSGRQRYPTPLCAAR